MSKLKVNSLESLNGTDDIQVVNRLAGQSPTAGNHLITKDYYEAHALDAVWNASKLQGKAISSDTPADKNLLYYDAASNSWKAGTITQTVSYGEMYTVANAQTTPIVTISTPVMIRASYESGYLNNFTHVNGRLIYTGTTVKVMKVSIAVRMNAVGNGRDLSAQVYKNGAPISKLSVRGFFDAGKGYTVSNKAMIEFSPNDYLEVWVANNTNVEAITVVDMNVIID